MTRGSTVHYTLPDGQTRCATVVDTHLDGTLALAVHLAGDGYADALLLDTRRIRGTAQAAFDGTPLFWTGDVRGPDPSPGCWH